MWRRERRFQNPFLFPCWKKKRFLESKEKGAFKTGAVFVAPRRPASFRPHGGPATAVTAYVGRNREKRAFYPAAAWVVGVAAWVGGRPQAAPTKTEKRSGRGGLWPPVWSGATVPSVILRVASLCHSERSEESVPPVLVRDRDTPSVTFGDSSLKEGAKDENYGFFGLRPQNDGDGARFFCVWGATTPAPRRRPRRTAPFFLHRLYGGYASQILWEPLGKAPLHKGFPHYPQGFPQVFM